MLRIRVLGRVPYREAHALQRALLGSRDDYLLLLEHPHVYTLGVRAKPEHLLADPAEVGAEAVRVDRGGDVTYHGPGQLVGYPILSVPVAPGSTPAHVHALEQVVIEALASLGLERVGRLPGYPGVWVDPTGPNPRKLCAVGVRLTRGRSMHGFALNVEPDLAYFERIVPCGIADPDKAVTSLRMEGCSATMAEVIDAVAEAAARRFARGGRVERQDASPPARAAVLGDRPGAAAGFFDGGGQGARQGPALGSGTPGGSPLLRRLVRAGVDPDRVLPLDARKPSFLRRPARMGAEFRALRGLLRDLRLETVCEQAGCPNIFECFGAGTATFMINGERCTRACGFCLVDTSRPLPPDPGEPERVAEAVARLGLAHAVVTAVARDDLSDGGASGFAETIRAIRRRCPGTTVEVLVPDFKGDEEALSLVVAARPDVLNHNLETVLRLQRAVRPQASYARSLALLARAKQAGLFTKSGIMVGLGETDDEVLGALADLRGVGVDAVTIGQYLRPSARHLPVARFVSPEGFDRFADAARALGFAHVQSSPLTRSSYHAAEAARARPVELAR